jgi:hypothetical protein
MIGDTPGAHEGKLPHISVAKSCAALVLSAGLAAAPSASAAPNVPGLPGTLNIAGTSVTYYTIEGDTLSLIAARLTDRPANWMEIGRINQIRSETSIPVGTAIRIPAALLPDQQAEGKVVALSGQVTAIAADGKRTPLRMAGKIHENVRVETGPGSFVTLALAGGSRLSLPSNSQVSLTTLRTTRHTRTPRTEIALLRGQVESRVTPLGNNGGRYEVRTPHSTASVRGTHFKVGLANAVVTNQVMSGSVDVSGPNGGTIRLMSGMGNVVSADAMSPPRDLLAAPGLLKLSAIESAVALALSPLPGATAYQIQIAKDHEGQDIVAEHRGASEKLQLDGLAQGSYYARISAIDASGLEGQAHLHAFRITGQTSGNGVTAGADAAQRKQLGSPTIKADGEKNLLLTWPGTPDQKFIVQIARDPKFTWLITTAEVAGPQLRVPRPEFGTYYARIRAVPPNAADLPFSLAQGFVVNDHWVMHDGPPVANKHRPTEGMR